MNSHRDWLRVSDVRPTIAGAEVCWLLIQARPATERVGAN